MLFVRHRIGTEVVEERADLARFFEKLTILFDEYVLTAERFGEEVFDEEVVFGDARKERFGHFFKACHEVSPFCEKSGSQ